MPTLVDILALPLPSKDTEPVTAPVSDIVLDVASLAAFATDLALSAVLSTLFSPTSPLCRSYFRIPYRITFTPS